MIYTGDDNPQDSKTAPQSAPRPGQGSSSAPPPPAPPAYENYRASPQVQPYRQVAVDSAALIPRDGQSAGQRFLRAFAAAALIWLLLTLFLQSLRWTIHWDSHSGSMDSWDYSVPSEVHLNTCVRGDDWKPVHGLGEPSSISKALAGDTPEELYRLNSFSSETFFDLPLSSDTLFFLSRGQNLGGAIQVKTSSEQAQDSAAVRVVIRYHNGVALERTKACLVKRKSNEKGVGIFGPVYRWGNPGSAYAASFEITVTLPEHSDSTPLIIKKFETDFPNSRHEIGDLGSKVLFDSISLKGSNSYIKVKSLTANAGDIHTSNGAITGTFSTNKTLFLKTSNAAITVDVNLRSESDDSRPILGAKSSNGAIVARINLISTSGQGGSFGVSTNTSNALLDVKFPTSPVDSTLDFKATTSNGRASAVLNPAYAGSFDLQTSAHFHADIDEHRVEDPSGKKRIRQVRYRHAGKGALAGDISWDPDNSERGKVVVSTSNAAVSVRV